MEDDHCHFLPMEDDPEASFFAVFDGHGGEGVGNGRWEVRGLGGRGGRVQLVLSTFWLHMHAHTHLTHTSHTHTHTHTHLTGDRVAHHVKEHLPKKITSTEAYRK